MVELYCKTNLDLADAEEWPESLPEVPRVGDTIESAMEWNGGFHLELMVTSVTWRQIKNFTGQRIWKPQVELHMTRWQQKLPCHFDGRDCSGSIRAFYEWYAPKVGRTVGNFI